MQWERESAVNCMLQDGGEATREWGRDCTWDICEVEGDGNGRRSGFYAPVVCCLDRLCEAEDEVGMARHALLEQRETPCRCNVR